MDFFSSRLFGGLEVSEAIDIVRTAKERPLQEIVVRKVTVLE